MTRVSYEIPGYVDEHLIDQVTLLCAYSSKYIYTHVHVYNTHTCTFHLLYLELLHIHCTGTAASK